MANLQTEQLRCVVSVLMEDRVGILRDLSAAVVELGGNVDGLSQTVSENFFTVILTAVFAPGTSTQRVEDCVYEHIPDPGAGVIVRPCRLDPPGAAAPEPQYIVTVRGKDRPGLLNDITAFLAGKEVNINDWFFRFAGEDVVHVGQVTIPASVDVRKMQQELGEVFGEERIRCALQHDNIFKVTNEVGPITSLLHP